MKYLSRHAVKFIGSKWFTVGLELFGDTTDDEHELNLISGDTSFCAMEVLKKWLEKKKGSWNDLIKALRTVELIFAADQIEEMLIPEVSGMYAWIISLCYLLLQNVLASPTIRDQQ